MERDKEPGDEAQRNPRIGWNGIKRFVTFQPNFCVVTEGFVKRESGIHRNYGIHGKYFK